MKKILKEIEFASSFCSYCKYFDYYNSPEYKERQKSGSRMSWLADDSLVKALIETYVGTDDAPTKTEVEEILERLNYKIDFKCSTLRNANIVIDIERDLVIPDSEDEILKVLDRFANILFAECPLSRTRHQSRESSVKGRTLITLAKIDFALLQRGIDIMKLAEIVDLYYYDRKEHVRECGYSYDLIGYYLDKYKLPPLFEKIDDWFVSDSDVSTSVPEQFRNDYAMSLLNRLVTAGYCDSNLQWIDKTQKVIICQVAHVIGGMLKIPDRRKWKPFEDLWEVERLAQSYSKRDGRRLDVDILKLYPDYEGK